MNRAGRKPANFTQPSYRLAIIVTALAIFLPPFGSAQAAEKTADRVSTATRVWQEPVTGMEFVWIPGGCYIMGNDSFADERPVHEVCVDGFWLGRYEVSNREYRRYRKTHDSKEYMGISLDADDHPVVHVSWAEATMYAKWLSKQGAGTFRLPTEAEWEYAARAGAKNSSYWGQREAEACKYGNLLNQSAKVQFGWTGTAFRCEDGYKLTAPVGRFRPNAHGLYDMLGNVWEWMSDGYDAEYYGKSPKVNPKGPTGRLARVRRGGSWGSRPAAVRFANRYGLSSSKRLNNLGFRLLRLP